MEEKHIEIKHNLTQDGDKYGKGDLCRDLDQENVLISYGMEKVKSVCAIR